MNRLCVGIIACLLLTGCSSSAIDSPTIQLSEDEMKKQLSFTPPRLITASLKNETIRIEIDRSRTFSVPTGRYDIYSQGEGMIEIKNEQKETVLQAPLKTNFYSLDLEDSLPHFTLDIHETDAIKVSGATSVSFRPSENHSPYFASGYYTIGKDLPEGVLHIKSEDTLGTFWLISDQKAEAYEWYRKSPFLSKVEISTSVEMKTQPGDMLYSTIPFEIANPK